MAHFLISYDLHNRRDYRTLIGALRRAGAARLHKSAWLLTTPSRAMPLLKALMRLIDHDDSVAVIELQPGSDWASVRAEPAGSTWLSARIANAGKLAA